MNTPWLDRRQLRAWIRLVGIVELLPAVLDAQLRRDADVTHFEYYVLAMLSEAHDHTLRMTELAHQTNATLPRLSHVVSRLEDRGLVERSPCPEDRRATNARLTASGWMKLQRAAPGHVANVRHHVIDALTDEQIDQLADIGGGAPRPAGSGRVDGGHLHPLRRHTRGSNRRAGSRRMIQNGFAIVRGSTNLQARGYCVQPRTALNGPERQSLAHSSRPPQENASISGAEVGCQGEVGSACSMAAGALCEALGGIPRQVENAAEVGIEHNLGLTCDPVGGLVQTPCIERNAIASMKAINAARPALAGNGSHKVSLDKAIKTMRETGRDMQVKYKETSRAGLAVNVIEC